MKIEGGRYMYGQGGVMVREGGMERDVRKSLYGEGSK
jgi:hypothetical protein